MRREREREREEEKEEQKKEWGKVEWITKTTLSRFVTPRYHCFALKEKSIDLG